MKITQKWLADIAKGKSFVEIGGLWGTVNERVTDAANAGAISLTMADIVPEGHFLWRKFKERCQSLDVSNVRDISIDFMTPGATEKIGKHDIVHCSGVLYHMPDIIGFLKNMRAVSCEYIIIGTMVVPEAIENDAGRLEFDGGSMLFLPAISEAQKAVVKKHFDDLGVHVHNVNGPIKPWTRGNGEPWFAPWWWLFSAKQVRRIMSATGLEVVDDGVVVEGRTHGFLCRVPS